MAHIKTFFLFTLLFFTANTQAQQHTIHLNFDEELTVICPKGSHLRKDKNHTFKCNCPSGQFLSKSHLGYKCLTACTIKIKEITVWDRDCTQSGCGPRYVSDKYKAVIIHGKDAPYFHERIYSSRAFEVKTLIELATNVAKNSNKCSKIIVEKEAAK